MPVSIASLWNLMKLGAVAFSVICALCLLVTITVKMVFLMCLHPKVIVYKSRLNKKSDGVRVYGQKKSVLVTCGKCNECLKRYQNDWTIRNYYQFMDTKVAVFFTLTYSEDSVPFTSGTDDPDTVARSVFKRDVQLFLKRFREFRRKNGYSTDFKYFITSEYGPTTLRPHYHGLLHGVTFREFFPFRRAWEEEFGFVQCREINCLQSKNALSSARYVAKYCAKGMFENPLVASGYVYPTFHLISNGLGKSYLSPERKRFHLALDFHNKRNRDGAYTTEYLDEIIKRSSVSIPPCTYALPRYYKNMVFAQSRGLSDAVAQRICDRFLEDYEGQLELIQTDKSPRARYEASIVLFDENLREEAQREVTARNSVAKYLKRSKL